MGSIPVGTTRHRCGKPAPVFFFSNERPCFSGSLHDLPLSAVFSHSTSSTPYLSIFPSPSVSICLSPPFLHPSPFLSVCLHLSLPSVSSSFSVPLRLSLSPSVSSSFSVPLRLSLPLRLFILLRLSPSVSPLRLFGRLRHHSSSLAAPFSFIAPSSPSLLSTPAPSPSPSSVSSARPSYTFALRHVQPPLHHVQTPQLRAFPTSQFPHFIPFATAFPEKIHRTFFHSYKSNNKFLTNNKK